MATLRTGQTTDFSNQGTEFSVDSWDTDGAEIKETYYIPEFAKYNGFYRIIPELRSVINKFGSWTFGRGIKSDKKNKEKLKKIKGNGRESPRSVLKNAWRVAMICGDSFAQIVQDNQGRMTNLKPLNPGKVAIVANEQGIIVGFEMQTPTEGTNIRYDVNEIYHLSYEREADEIHGIPFAEALETLILARNEAISDLKLMYHRNVFPMKFFMAETDDETKLEAIETTINNAYKKTENVVLPAGAIKEINTSSIAQYSTLDPLPYIKFLVRQFVTACGMPEVVMGWGEATTEASANIIYLAFQQEIEDMQLYNQEACEIQLNIIIDLEFPASIEMAVKENEAKRGKGTTMQPNKDG